MPNYCEYYLYQLYVKYGEQDFIPAYPMQLNISGDTGQDPVIKRCQSTNCGYVEPIEPQYRWILSGYTCQGFDKYERYIEQVSNDDGLTWSNTGNEAASGLVETNSTDCGYVGRLTRWINSGTTCYEGDKYVRIVEQVSYDNINWTNTGNISRGYLIETDSPDCIQYRWVDIPITTDYICDDCPEGQYRWAVTTGYVCSGTNKMTKEVYQVSYDSGNTWNNVTPEQSRAALPIIETNSTDCGYAERTVTSYTCHNYDKYLLSEYQISSDGGSTWSTTGSGETLVETNSEYCGFIPPEPQYRTLTTATTCIGYDKYTLSEYQVSYDSGVTWTTTGTSATTLIEADSTDCGYVPIDYSGQYFTTVARENGTFSFAKSSANTNTDIQYSLDSGATWNTLVSGSSTPTVTTGNKVYWKGTLTANSTGGIGRFTSTGQFDVEGNTMSLLYGDNFEGQTSLTGKVRAFSNLFSGCTTVINAKNMVLPATTLANYCYYSMFDGCTSLTTAPTLPATTLASNCYGYMFSGCTSLTTAPQLPATTLASSCYYLMFAGCTSLTTAPQLPATTLATNCYYFMFDGCTSLTTAPELPATTLANGCYHAMFAACRSLTTAPAILPATTLVDYCYFYMFSGCISLTTAPELPATTLANYCYYSMFYGCRSLNYIKCLATNRSASNCVNNWVNGVSSTGTFVKDANTTWPSGTSGIPSGWTIQNA